MSNHYIKRFLKIFLVMAGNIMLHTSLLEKSAESVRNT